MKKVKTFWQKHKLEICVVGGAVILYGAYLVGHKHVRMGKLIFDEIPTPSPFDNLPLAEIKEQLMTADETILHEALIVVDKKTGAYGMHLRPIA